MIDKQIDERFFRVYLRDEVAGATDFNTLIHHDIQFLDLDYHQFVYGMLWSAKVDGKRTYFYVVLRIGDDLSDIFFKSIINEVVSDQIPAWHTKEFPYESEIPMVECIMFRCDRKKVDGAEETHLHF